jgi:3-phosphoshikimate 1-carboxyvinyltransferase
MSLLASSDMLISGLSDCEDVGRSLEAFRALGGRAESRDGDLLIHGLGGNLVSDRLVEIDCGNSGTTIRLLMGILAARGGRFRLDGDRQLRARPMARVAGPLGLMGAAIETTSGRPPVSIEGRSLSGADIALSDASAQLKSALLLAGLSASSQTTVTVPMASRDHTERLIAHFGGEVETRGLKITVRPTPLRLPANFKTPGDPSSAAFLLTAAAMVPGGRVTAENVLLAPGRTGFLRVLERLGAEVGVTPRSDDPEPVGDVTVAYGGELEATEITASEIPALIDEVPVLALAAAAARGETVFRQVGELRIKETDRLAAIRDQLGALGALTSIEGDDLRVIGPASLTAPASLDSGHDHRLAMTLVLARKLIGSDVPVAGLESIPLSYPGVMADLEKVWRP